MCTKFCCGAPFGGLFCWWPLMWPGCLLSLWSTVCRLIPVHGHPWRGQHDMRTIGGEFLFCPLLVVHPVPLLRLLVAVLLIHGWSGGGRHDLCPTADQSFTRGTVLFTRFTRFTDFHRSVGENRSAPKQTGRHRSGTFTTSGRDQDFLRSMAEAAGASSTTDRGRRTGMWRNAVSHYRTA